MQKTLILGVLFACTTITYSAFDRNDTPPIARLKSENLEHSLKHSDTGNSPECQFQDTPPHRNFNSSFSLRPDSLQQSATPTHSTQASPNHFENNVNVEADGRPSTPVKENDEECLRLYQEIINAYLTNFEQNLEKAKNWESEQRSEIKNAQITATIVDAMRNPDHSPVVSAKTNSDFLKIQNDYPFKSKQPFSYNGQYPSKTRE